ncbi:MAG: S49 family peptidase [Proteobacteria bacterium]|nr:S49 family peptidase [Pseudomonadota bacterium]
MPKTVLKKNKVTASTPKDRKEPLETRRRSRIGDFTAAIGKIVYDFLNPPDIIGVLRLNGVIGSSGRGKEGLTAHGLAPLIERVFDHGRVKAVALVINSPGGSPVQSSLIAKHIRALADEKKKPVLAFVEDVAASGGYWLACAADEIHASPASIVGSIGVVSAGFGFSEAIEKLGIERRVYSEGKYKSVLDPFKPEKESDVALLKDLQKDLHAQFKAYVSERREGKLTAKPEEVFSGRFWLGNQGLELGLVDGLGDMRSVCRARFGDKVVFRVIAPPRPILFKILQGVKLPTAVELTDAGLSTLEDRAHWQRFGL